MAALWGALFMIGLFGGITWLAITQTKKVKANLAALAARRGLRVVEEKHAFGSTQLVSGLAQGREVRFWTYTTGGGKSRTTWVAVGVRPRATGLTFEFRRQGFTTSVMGFFGSKEVTFGDAAFDKAWFVRTNQPVLLRAALVPDIRAKLLAHPSRRQDGDYKLADGLVQFAERGTFHSNETIARLEAKLPLLHDLADVVEVCSSSG
jgi:hypothetical protein